MTTRPITRDFKMSFAIGTDLTASLDDGSEVSWVTSINTKHQMRRWMLGKSSQTFTPQKCEPSVQMGVVMLARRWHGGPT